MGGKKRVLNGEKKKCANRGRGADLSVFMTWGGNGPCADLIASVHPAVNLTRIRRDSPLSPSTNPRHCRRAATRGRGDSRRSDGAGSIRSGGEGMGQIGRRGGC